MSSGSKVQKTIKKVSAEQILEERDARNNRARANMMLREQKKAMEAADEYEEPGLALKPLEKDAEEAYCKKAVQEKEYGAWCSEEDPHGLLAVDDLPDAGDGSDQEVKDAPDQEEKEEEMPEAHDDELPDETEDVKEEAEDANDETEEAQRRDGGGADSGRWLEQGLEPMEAAERWQGQVEPQQALVGEACLEEGQERQKGRRQGDLRQLRRRVLPWRLESHER